MAAINIFLSYPTAEGYSDFIDITEDVIESSIGDIKQSLESNEFDVGKITFDSIKLELRNEDSKYSEATNPVSIFPLKRDRSIIKIEWDINSDGIYCGNFFCGETFLSESRVVFKGLLEENTTVFDVESQNVKFKILGLDSIINKVDTPFASLDLADNFNTLIYKILNQPEITKFFVVEQSNINCKLNLTCDNISSLENTKCLEALQEILLMSNSILFIKDNICFVKGRNVDAVSSFTFYGPSSDEGIENITNISEYSIGLNRCWNFFTWRDTTIVQKFVDSIDLYGIRKKEFDSELITDNGKRIAILNSYLNEFGFPKTELTLTVPMTTQIADLSFLNKINIDYPSMVLPSVGQLSARYNQAKYDEQDTYAEVINSLFISVSEEWKILNRTIRTKNHEIDFKIRRV